MLSKCAGKISWAIKNVLIITLLLGTNNSHSSSFFDCEIHVYKAVQFQTTSLSTSPAWRRPSQLPLYYQL